MNDIIKIGSLFSGIGGLELGIERGLAEYSIDSRTIWQCEIDHFARSILKRHWPTTTIYEDIRTMEGIEHVDLICGGFPCQDLSYAGRRAGLAGKRSGLFWELMRIVRMVGPRYVVLENVPGLLTADEGEAMGSVLGALASCGYDAEWDCIPASSVGAHHRRDRIFVVAYTKQNGRLNNETGSDDTRMVGTMATSCGDRPEQAIRSKYRGSFRLRQGDRCNSMSSQWMATPEPERLTLTGVGDLADGVPRWVAERIGALGNAVVPQVAQVVGRRIAEIHTQHMETT